MGLTTRPYIGTWQMRGEVERQVPDCVVYVNGYPEVAGCQTCGKAINIQKYITTVSVEPSVEPVATATVELSIPKVSSQLWGIDGNPILKPGLEIVVFMRGAFPVTDLWDEGEIKQFTGININGESTEDSVEWADVNASKVPIYPYYQVFRGVVTEVSMEYSSGKYSASLTCADILHFWQYLYLSTNGAIFGDRPANSLVEPSMVGHKLTGMTPYGIMYTLVRSAFGAAFGVEWGLNQQTNVAAVSQSSGNHLFTHAAKWWEKRWQQHSGSLRIYGMDGSLYNAFSQAYLGLGGDDASNAHLVDVIDRIRERDPGTTHRIRGTASFKKAARELGYDPVASVGAVLPNSQDNAVLLDILKMQAYTLDVGAMGQLSNFETEYMSKLEIANAVRTITGFEFYQDVDGDLVFKPPFYNLDTSDDPVFVIRNLDIISFSEQQREPEATMVNASGSGMTNVRGVGLDGAFGKKTTYVDYRLVAEYGWKEETFECHYLSSTLSLYISCISRLDVANVGMKSCTLSIPLRPELRPGYPIYIESEDCFYYIQSMSHSFSFGGQCTTSIQGVGKRAKFVAPGEPPEAGQLPSVSNIQLEEPFRPKVPLYVYPEDVSSGSSSGASGPLRMQGYPNVVLALDPNTINYNKVPITQLPSLTAYIRMAERYGILYKVGEVTDRQWGVTSANTANPDTIFSLSQLREGYTNVRTALSNDASLEQIQQDRRLPTSTFAAILARIEASRPVNVEGADDLTNWISLQESLQGHFSPGNALPGEYVYYSASSPDAKQQASGRLKIDQDQDEAQVVDAGSVAGGSSILLLQDKPGGGVQVKTGVPQRGFEITALDATSGGVGTQTATVSTADIRFITFAVHEIVKEQKVLVQGGSRSLGSNLQINIRGLTAYMTKWLNAYSGSDADPEATLEKSFGYVYWRFAEPLQALADGLGRFALGGLGSYGVDSNELMLACFTLQTGLYTISPDKTHPMTPDTTRASLNPTLGNNDPKVRKKLAGMLGTLLATTTKSLLSLAIQNAAAKVASGTASADVWPALYTLRNGFLDDISSTFGGQTDQLQIGQAGTVTLGTPQISANPVTAPIFPVSDGRGYEVVGGLPYGRGLNLESYATLFEASRDSAGSSQLRSGSVDVSTMRTIEDFLVLYAATEDAAIALGALSVDQQASLAAALEYPGYVDGNQSDVLKLSKRILEVKNASTKLRARNSVVTSHHWTQKLGPTSAIQNLASLTWGSPDNCACNGGDSEYLGLAYSLEYSTLEEYALSAGEALAEPYTYGMDAVTGKTVSSGLRDLAAQFAKEIEGGRSVGDILTGGGATVGETLAQQAGELVTQTENIDEEVSGDDDTSDEG